MNKAFPTFHLIIFLFLTSTGYSAPAEMPTSASKPIPSLQKTQNIDTVLSEKVQTLIRKNPLLKNQAISAGSRNQVITLQGSVDTQSQVNTAIKAAKSVKGVKKVESQLTVRRTKK
jgi:osmotically-inducible protein OsmY